MVSVYASLKDWDWVDSLNNLFDTVKADKLWQEYVDE